MRRWARKFKLVNFPALLLGHKNIIVSDSIDQQLQKVIGYLESELSKIRGNRANPDLLADLKVSAYDTKMPLNQLGTISIVDATLITVEPWDKNLIEEIEKTIRNSDLGLSPVVDKDQIKVPLPPLSEERRQEFVKVAKQKAEEAKVSVRHIRHELLSEREEAQKQGDITEDDLESVKREIQKAVDSANSSIEELFKNKEKELLTL